MAEPSKKLFQLSRLGSPHHNTSDKSTYHHLLLQTLANPILFQPKAASAAQPTNLHHLALFHHSLGDIFPGAKDADDTRYPKIDTRQRLARHWLMFGFGVRHPVPVSQN
jgi:hypothetical protein